MAVRFPTLRVGDVEKMSEQQPRIHWSMEATERGVEIVEYLGDGTVRAYDAMPPDYALAFLAKRRREAQTGQVACATLRPLLTGRTFPRRSGSARTSL